MTLLVDIGNSRIKYARLENGKLVDCRTCTHTDNLLETWRDFENISHVFACNVAGPAISQKVNDWCESTGSHIRWVKSTDPLLDLQHCYENPASLGDDRWVAMVGARVSYSGDLCVIDCGTATTVDLLDASGNHKGGAILPGVSTMRAALHQRAHDLPDVAAEVQAFSNTTEKAISGGTAYALAAAIDRMITEAHSIMNAEPTCIIGGGEAALVLPLIQQNCTLDTKLVLTGLAVVAENT